MTSLKNKFVYQLLLSASQVLLPLLTYPYITRVLGPENLGKVNYVDFVSQVFMILAAFGIPFYAIREIAMNRDDAVKRAALIKELIVLQSIFAVLSSVFFVLFTYKSWALQPALYTLGFMNILIGSFSFDWYIQGMEKFRFAAIRTVLIRMAMLFSFFILVTDKQDYPVYFAIFSAGMLLIACFNFSKLMQENHFTHQPINVKKHLVPLWHFFLTASAISIYVYFDTIILKYISQNDSVVGYYTIVLKIVKIFLVLIIAVSTVLMPRMSYLVNSGNTGEIKKHSDSLLRFIILAAVPISSGLFMLAPEIIETIAGKAFLPAIPIMRILAFLPIIIGLSNLFCFQVLVPFKQEKKFLLAVTVGCISSVSLNFLLIPSFSATGAACATTITEILITILTGIQAYRLLQFTVQPVLVLQAVFASLLFFPLILLCKNIFVSPLVILSIAVPSCFLLYYIVQYFIFNNVILKEIKHYVQQLLKR